MFVFYQFKCYPCPAFFISMVCVMLYYILDLNCICMKSSWHGHLFRITGLLFGESSDQRETIPPPHHGPVMWGFDVFLCCCLEHAVEKSPKLSVIRDAVTLMWCHCTLLWRHNGRNDVSNHEVLRLFTQSIIQAQIKENIKAPRHWPLCEEFTGDRWISHTNDQ